jgi:uncharacterized membrane protein
MQLDLAVLTFPGLEDAERAFADVRDRSGEAPWLDELALVQHRWDGRMVVRGTLAGRYVDVDEEGDPIGPSTAVGALTGALVGLLFGPPGFAAGLVAGAVAGGVIQAREAEQLRGGLFDEIRETVPEGESALLLVAEREHVDAMIDAFDRTGARLKLRRTLSDDAVAGLQAMLAAAPPAAADQTRASA